MNLLSPQDYSSFYWLSNLTEVRQNLKVDLIFISLTAKDDEHFLSYFFAIVISSIGNSMFGYLVHFYWVIVSLIIRFDVFLVFD